MGIDLGRASVNAAELSRYAAELRNVRGRISMYRSEVLSNWEGREVSCYTGAMSSIESRLNSAANELESIGRDISSAANEIWQEEEAERRRREEEERRRREEEDRKRREEEQRAAAAAAAAVANIIGRGGLK